MGKYIHLFQTKEEFNQAVDNNFTEPWVSYTKENDKVDYYKTEEARKLEKPFTIEATQDGTTVYFRQSQYAVDDGLDPLKVEVSTDNGETWTEVTAAPAEDDVPGATLAELDEGERVLIRGNNEVYGYYSDTQYESVENCNFYADSPCYVYGNIMSLISGDDFAGLREVKEHAFAYFFVVIDEDFSWVLLKDGNELLLPATTLAEYCYYGMFQGCTGLTAVPKLPAMTLANSCYAHLFDGCTSLTSAPELPATTLVDNCYGYMLSNTGLIIAPELPATTLANDCYTNMFQGCTNLTAIPELPATTLANRCYNSMFSGCTSLTKAPELPATTLAESCYRYMFEDCTSLATVPALPVTTLTSDCYCGMFRGCASLTNAPELPATTLTNNCYSRMFSNCTGLTSAPELPAMTLASYCYENMFNNCTNLTSAPELPATTLVDNCYNSMFNGCTGLTSAPELPATTLAGYCYVAMFQGCTNLSYIKAMFTTTPGTSYTRNWVQDVKGTGTFVKNSAASWNVTGNNGVPSGWTVETASE